MDPLGLPQSAVEHLWPFLCLLALSAATFVVLVKALLGARALVREESIEALKTDAGKEVLRGVVAEAVTGMIEPLKDAIAEQRRSSIAQGDRLGKLEQWQARADVALSLLAKHEEHFGRIDRGLLRIWVLLKRAKLTDPEELGP
jgi:hypothetical protein